MIQLEVALRKVDNWAALSEQYLGLLLAELCDWCGVADLKFITTLSTSYNEEIAMSVYFSAVAIR